MTPVTNEARPEPVADPPEPEAQHLFVEAGRLKEAIREQMKVIVNHPSADEQKAKARARDARTVSSLVRSMERLLQVEKELEKKGTKAKSRRHAELKESIIRKLDRYIAAKGQGSVSEGSKSG